MESKEHVFIITILIPPTPYYYCTPPHFVNILRTASDIILLRPPNFTDYWDRASPLHLLDLYYN